MHTAINDLTRTGGRPDLTTTAAGPRVKARISLYSDRADVKEAQLALTDVF